MLSTTDRMIAESSKKVNQGVSQAVFIVARATWTLLLWLAFVVETERALPIKDPWTAGFESVSLLIVAVSSWQWILMRRRAGWKKGTRTAWMIVSAFGVPLLVTSTVIVHIWSPGASIIGPGLIWAVAIATFVITLSLGEVDLDSYPGLRAANFITKGVLLCGALSLAIVDMLEGIDISLMIWRGTALVLLSLATLIATVATMFIEAGWEFPDSEDRFF